MWEAFFYLLTGGGLDEDEEEVKLKEVKLRCVCN